MISVVFTGERHFRAGLARDPEAWRRELCLPLRVGFHNLCDPHDTQAFAGRRKILNRNFAIRRCARTG
jgi:hypothetical protein